MLKSITCACRSQEYFASLLQLTFSARFSGCRRNFFLLSHNCLFNHNTRNFVDKNTQVEEQESFARFWEHHRLRVLHRRESLPKMLSILQCDRKEAERLLDSETELFVENLESTCRKAEFLIADGISSNTILNNLWLLHIVESRLRTYLRAMKLWGIDDSLFEEFIPLFDVAPNEFFFISENLIEDKNGPYGNRVLYFANRLECSVSELLPRMLRKKFLFTKPIDYMKEIFDIYKEYGIKNEDILSDLSGLCAKKALLLERLEILRNIGYHPIKPWLGRYEYRKFEKTINFFLAEKEAAKYRSREGFFAAKMEVDVNELRKDLQRKYPYLFRIRALTFMNKLKFFLSEGYVLQELLCSPFAFYPSTSTLKNRIITLQKLGLEKPALSVVIKNEDAFQNFTNNLLAVRGLKDSEIDENTSSDSEKN